MSIQDDIKASYAHALRLAECHQMALECIERPSLEVIHTLARGNCVEIGTRHGISTLALLDGAAHVFSIDIDKSCDGLFPSDWPWTFLHGDGARIGNGWEGPPADLLLIDGNHTYASVKAELNSWWFHLATGADIFLHDAYEGNGIRKAIEEFCAPRKLSAIYEGILAHILT